MNKVETPVRDRIENARKRDLKNGVGLLALSCAITSFGAYFGVKAGIDYGHFLNAAAHINTHNDDYKDSIEVSTIITPLGICGAIIGGSVLSRANQAQAEINAYDLALERAKPLEQPT